MLLLKLLFWEMLYRISGSFFLNFFCLTICQFKRQISSSIYNIASQEVIDFYYSLLLLNYLLILMSTLVYTCYWFWVSYYLVLLYWQNYFLFAFKKIFLWFLRLIIGELSNSFLSQSYAYSCFTFWSKIFCMNSK